DQHQGAPCTITRYCCCQAYLDTRIHQRPFDRTASARTRHPDLQRNHKNNGSCYATTQPGLPVQAVLRRAHQHSLGTQPHVRRPLPEPVHCRYLGICERDQCAV
ncbi:hypothetical protein GGI13_008138, partial [Coemansia sp. RSA 455]